jgi:hypothetical protein
MKTANKIQFVVNENRFDGNVSLPNFPVLPNVKIGKGGGGGQDI